MKLRTAIACILAQCILCLCFVGCAGEESEFSPAYIDSGHTEYEIKLTQSIPGEKVNLINSGLWISPEDAYNDEDVTVVAKGVISNIRELSITDLNKAEATPEGGVIIFNLEAKTKYASVFDFTIEECYRGGKPRNTTVTVYYDFTSYSYPYDPVFPDKYLIEEGQTYYLFLTSSERIEASYLKRRAELLEEGRNIDLYLDDKPISCYLADYSVAYANALLICAGCPEEYIKWATQTVFGSERLETEASKAFFAENSYTAEDYEELLRAYFAEQ